MIALAVLACGGPPSALPPVRVRGGEVRASGEGRRLPDGRVLVAEGGASGPVGCVRLFSVPLPEASAAVATGGASPDTALSFSPDGSRLAIGAWGGHLLLVDAWTGDVLARTRLAETAIRSLLFVGDELWVAEQSPDADVVVLSTRDLSVLARRRLADDVGTASPASDDPYGLYQLPSAYALFALPDGSVVALATHGWDTPEGRRNASRVLRLQRRGEGLDLLAAWPEQGAADVVFGAADLRDGRLAVALRRSAPGPAPDDLPIDGVREWSLPMLQPAADRRFPLAAGFPQVFVWDALALVSGGLVVGTADGRVLGEVEGVPFVDGLGAPSDPSVPIAASVGFLRADGAEVWAVTSRSWAPGSSDPETRPGRLHPNERVVAHWHRDGATLVPAEIYRSPYEVGGLVVTDRDVVVAAGPREDDRTDLFGALVFERGSSGPPVVCATEGPAYHVLAVSSERAVAVAEVPWRDGDAVRGTYRVTVSR